MIDRLELAKQYVQEMLEKRDDIVGAFVVGSVARGDATETSDIDLALIVEGAEGKELQRGGVDTWRDGVYIEAALAPMEQYRDVEKVLRDRFAATQMNDALILYDPTGVLTRVQEGVRAGFMEPRWLGARVGAQLQSLRESVASLREAVAAQERSAVCEYEGWVQMWLSSIPLVIHGVSPSSTRALLQLEAVSPEWKEQVCEWEGSARLRQEEVLALLPTASESLSLIRATGSSQWGDICSYMVKKADWLARNGHHREAPHLLWYVVGGLDEVIRETDDSLVVSKAQRLIRKWMRSVGWEGQDVLEEKVRIAEEMVAEVEAMAAHLPSAEV